MLLKPLLPTDFYRNVLLDNVHPVHGWARPSPLFGIRT